MLNMVVFQGRIAQDIVLSSTPRGTRHRHLRRCNTWESEVVSAIFSTLLLMPIS